MSGNFSSKNQQTPLSRRAVLKAGAGAGLAAAVFNAKNGFGNAVLAQEAGCAISEEIDGFKKQPLEQTSPADFPDAVFNSPLNYQMKIGEYGDGKDEKIVLEVRDWNEDNFEHPLTLSLHPDYQGSINVDSEFIATLNAKATDRKWQGNALDHITEINAEGVLDVLLGGDTDQLPGGVRNINTKPVDGSFESNMAAGFVQFIGIAGEMGNTHFVKDKQNAPPVNLVLYIRPEHVEKLDVRFEEDPNHKGEGGRAVLKVFNGKKLETINLPRFNSMNLDFNVLGNTGIGASNQIPGYNLYYMNDPKKLNSEQQKTPQEFVDNMLAGFKEQFAEQCKSGQPSITG